jgi:3-deoxy-manno-octulosonate cytidylyltransferase (CMP-KDO synthetase)
MKVIGIIPARMAASRFPGKPLKLIKGKPMIEHVFERAKMYKKWSMLSLATCDKEIKKFAKIKNYNCVMTSKKHTRCLDRVFEASNKLNEKPNNNDIIVCVQGDEPLLHPKMIESVVDPLLKNKKILSTVLAMDIIHYSQFINPNIVKIVHDLKGEVLFTSRSPIPYSKKLSRKMNAKRVGGIFAFRYFFLKRYFNLKPSPLEINEACDINRICDNGGGLYIASVKYRPYFSVDTIVDLRLVNKSMSNDVLWKKYNF